MKTHIRDLRLFNNTGMSIPVCQAGKETINVDSISWPVATSDDYTKSSMKECYCKHCVKAWNKQYSWARIPE